jgi:predicted ATPase
MYLSAVRRHRAGDEAGFPWSVPVVAALKVLEFTTPITFFVGENGSGKSTVLEGIAAGMRAVAIGSADLDTDPTLEAARQFAAGFRFERRQQARTKLFFRAEDMFGFTRRMLHTMTDLGSIEEEFRRSLPVGSYGQKLAMGAARGQGRALEGRYGKDPDAHSHGEVFLGLLASRLVPGGLCLSTNPRHRSRLAACFSYARSSRIVSARAVSSSSPRTPRCCWPFPRQRSRFLLTARSSGHRTPMSNTFSL